ncbi:MAG TPA: bifunctional DNA-binding transcriptional regulator/O6-methylguanine-DNA methyltransferase Ada [Nitrospiraceae bacterium]|nr:bifunctional DNA-binding transcriptional regulator/O6-methylguanine-DNA methyltransferase Ada [Nitrospiraceae bacterium]
MPPVDATLAWRAVLNHDRRCDGAFVYAVSSTNVYCRPSCPSRRPARRHVTFFKSPQLAEAAGFRACLRCRPHLSHHSGTEQRVEQARRYLDAHTDEPITLRQLAAEVGISSFHMHRTFTRVIGLSPKAYQDARRMERFKSSLKRGETVTHAAYEAGFGSSSRLYERAHANLGMTPSTFRSGGAGVLLRYTTVPTAAGRLLVAVTERGIAAVSLGGSEAALITTLRRDFPNGILRHDANGLNKQVRGLLRCFKKNSSAARLPLDVQATAFQRKVWLALQQIPRGQTRSYQEIARAIGRPTAARAVARACARNPIALAIPCHRALRGTGHLAGYRWGLQRKKQLLALEQQ